MSNTNTVRNAALASLAIAEAMMPDAPVVVPAPAVCDCCDCYEMELGGFTLPTGPNVACGAEALIRDRDQRWALAADWEATMAYEQRRYEMKRREWSGYYDQPEPETREEVIERFLQAA